MLLGSVLMLLLITSNLLGFYNFFLLDFCSRFRVANAVVVVVLVLVGMSYICNIRLRFFGFCLHDFCYWYSCLLVYNFATTISC